jgi:hypothetical protein
MRGSERKTTLEPWSVGGRIVSAIFSRPILLALPATLLLFFGHVAFSTTTFWFRDILHFFYPMKSFLSQSLRQGFWPYWCSNHSCGTPFLDDIQAGVLYPLSWIFLLPLPYSFNWYVLIHLGLGFLFCYLFLREIGASPQAATLAGISFCYGGFTIATINTLNNLSTVIWLPAILWARRRAFRRRKAQDYLRTVLFLCLAMLGGEPQLFLMIAGLVFFYDLSFLLQLSAGPATYLRHVLTDAALLFSAMVVALPQLGPTYANYQNSARFGASPMMTP